MTTVAATSGSGSYPNNYGTVGLNADKVGAMQQALQDYYTAVASKIGIEATRADIQRGIKGSNSENTLNQLNEAINQQLKTLTAKLNSMSEVFKEMQAAYAKNDTENSSFTSATKSINSAGEGESAGEAGSTGAAGTAA